jgi:hypothetical protein
MTIFITKVAMSISLLIFIFCSFVSIRSKSCLSGFGTLISCCCGEDVASWDTWFIFIWATKALLEVPTVLITPSCTSLSSSLIKDVLEYKRLCSFYH